MTDSVKKEMRGSVDIVCDNSPGAILVEIVRHLYSKAATLVATATCEKLFAGEMPVEDIIFAANARGLELHVGGVFRICGLTTDAGEINIPLDLAAIEESVKVPPGFLQSYEVREAEDEPPAGTDFH